MTNMIPTLINGRWELILPEHRAARPQWKIENGGWEPERLAAMAEVIGPGHVVYDIGAEEGDFPALWASWGADVVLVEPNPRVWPNIRVIFESNNIIDKVRTCFVGFAGDFERPYTEEFLAEHIGLEGESFWPRCAYGPIIGDHGFLVLPERPDVSVTTIDSLSNKYGPPTDITIDVEGAELTVLRGAKETLKNHRPMVFVSVHIDIPGIDEKYPDDTREKLDDYMKSLNYAGTHLATDHEVHMLYQPVE